jgi:hypothetical protein
MVLEDIPVPIALPFGYFPIIGKKKAGIIFPEYGESPNQGFFLRNLGYYLPINDYMDLKLTGDIYSLGTLRASAMTNYVKRYNYNGSLNLSFSKTVIGESTDPNYSQTNDFQINWQHSQDPKASPRGQFRASVEAGTSTYLTNTSFATNNFLRNSLNSSVTYTRNFQNKPYTLNLAARHSQNTQTKQISITIPEVNFNINRLEPFKRKNFTGGAKWYERIGFQYSMNSRSEIKGYEKSLFSSGNFADSILSGFQHVIPISLNLTVLKYFTVTPSFNYTERWYFRQVNQLYDAESRLVKKDTVRGFYRLYDYSYNIGMNFRLFGLAQFKKAKVMAVRHVMSTTIGMGFRPDFGTDGFGYYRSVTDSNGRTTRYTPFAEGIYGVPGSGRSASINISIDNNLEAKVKSKSDSTNGFKKIKLIDNLGFNASYNLAADSFQLSNISMNGRTTFSNGFSVQINAQFDPYAYSNGLRTKTLWVESNDFKLARLSDITFIFTGSIRGKAQGGNYGTRNIDIRNYDPNRFIDFRLPYSLNFNLVLGYTPSTNNTTPSVMRQSLQISGDVRLTTKWKTTFSGGYDFVRGELTGTQIGIYRDLHCWDMSFNWIPFGFRQSYTFDIRVKSQLLQELRLTRRRDWYDF